MGGFAWVTLATNDSYSLGALVLAHSLKQVGTSHPLAILVTPGVTGPMRNKLAAVFDVVQEVNILDSKDEANLKLLKRPELGITFTKLHCWRLTQFDKCVFLDADTLVLKKCDELFEREELSAAPDVGWPDCFNSGVFVYRPSNDTYDKLVQFALEKGSFDGGDQGLLNLYFSDWASKDISKHLPFIYNLCSTACYSYLPAFKQFGADTKIIHFIGSAKPWLQYFNTESRKVQPSSDYKHLEGILQHWWNIFCAYIHDQLSTEMGGLAGALAQLTLGAPRTTEQSALDDHLRRQGWEVGNIDYMGRDSFANIWSKICETISGPPTAKTAEATPSSTSAEPAKKTEETAPPPQDTSAQPAESPKPKPVSEPQSIATPESKPTESTVATGSSEAAPAATASDVTTTETPAKPEKPQSTDPPKPAAESAPTQQPPVCPLPPKPTESTQPPVEGTQIPTTDSASCMKASTEVVCQIPSTVNEPKAPVQEQPAPAQASAPSATQEQATPATQPPPESQPAAEAAQPPAGQPAEAAKPAEPTAAPAPAPSTEAPARTAEVPAPAPARTAEVPAPAPAPRTEAPVPAPIAEAVAPVPTAEAAAPAPSTDAPAPSAPVTEAPAPSTLSAKAPAASAPSSEAPVTPAPSAEVQPAPVAEVTKSAKSAAAAPAPAKEEVAKSAEASKAGKDEPSSPTASDVKAEGSSKAKTEKAKAEPAGAAAAQPTPPPRKAGGGGKKSKSKK